MSLTTKTQHGQLVIPPLYVGGATFEYRWK